MEAQPLYATAAARDRIAQLIGQGGNGGGGRNVNETDFNYEIYIVKITGTETAGGIYKGRLCGGLLKTAPVVSTNITPPGDLIVPSTDNLTIVNLFELGTTTHSLATNSFCYAILADADSTGRRVAYVLQAATHSTIRFKISSSASGGGKYNGKTVSGLSSATGTGNLAEADFGTVNSTEDLLCLNVREVGKSTHDVSSSTYLPLIFIGIIIGYASGKAIVAFDGMQWQDC